MYMYMKAYVFISFYACMCCILEGAPSQDMFLLLIAVEKHEMMFAVLVVVNKYVSGSQPGLQAATAAARHNACSVVLAGPPRGGARRSSASGLQLQAAARFLFDARDQNRKHTVVLVLVGPGAQEACHRPSVIVEDGPGA